MSQRAESRGRFLVVRLSALGVAAAMLPGTVALATSTHLEGSARVQTQPATIRSFNNQLTCTLDGVMQVDAFANDAKTMGINGTSLLPDCRAGGTREPLTLIRYRCCYDR